MDIKFAVVKRYDEPNELFGVHARGNFPPRLVNDDQLADFVYGDKITVTADDLRESDVIPLEWKSKSVDDEFILSRVIVFDNIDLIH